MVTMGKIAIISDIHGNMPALDAVLRDIRERDIRRVFCLGDLVGKGPHSDKAVDICRSECEIVLRGNWDQEIARHHESAVLQWHRQRLGAERLDYLASLPNTLDFWLSGKNVRLFHASQIGVLYRVHAHDPIEKHLAMFENTDFTGNHFKPDIVGYADIHQAYLRNYRGKLLFNAGSVGNPLDEPLASYAIMEGNFGDGNQSRLSVSLVRLPYDIELAIKQARDEEMPELAAYENELRTAVYRGIPPRK